MAQLWSQLEGLTKFLNMAERMSDCPNQIGFDPETPQAVEAGFHLFSSFLVTRVISRESSSTFR
jgi:hypothetical protein